MREAAIFIERISVRKKEDGIQLRLLNCGDALELSKFKKRTKLKAVRVFNSKEQKTEFFDNRIGVITVEELAVIFRLAPKTIRSWIARGKIPHVRVGRRYFFQKRSLEKWLNQKEEPLWE